jgi:hypothetical protein
VTASHSRIIGPNHSECGSRIQGNSYRSSASISDRSTVARSVVAGRLGGGGPMHAASAGLEMASTGPMVVRKNA